MISPGRHSAESAAWVPPQRPECSCPEHLEDLAGLVVPFADGGGTTAAELVDDGALSATPARADERWLSRFAPPDGVVEERVGPFHWALWIGDDAALCYDAATPLDELLLSLPGVDRVEWLDREAFLVGAPTLCADGMTAAAARALADPRARRRQAP